VGTVYGRWADKDYRVSPWLPGHNEGWTVLGDARGDVRIPEGCLVRLNVADRDLGFLANIDCSLSFSWVRPRIRRTRSSAGSRASRRHC
jgi:hypothetical protein